eukprot:CAMPEP_0119404742 /NCGR_PEP_ID=MMETSP1334-20130426/144050_1 /TAXON_ID=127549 /ORGANISM="Calcidiscus leptoporus, Strain RCC1130" /LENGTH=109 /DNA_ID=CAMNT_0007428713 /DNA_START=659 /DNA_END=988 /DNA_ORIENTATION=+
MCARRLTSLVKRREHPLCVHANGRSSTRSDGTKPGWSVALCRLSLDAAAKRLPQPSTLHTCLRDMYASPACAPPAASAPPSARGLFNSLLPLPPCETATCCFSGSIKAL